MHQASGSLSVHSCHGIGLLHHFRVHLCLGPSHVHFSPSELVVESKRKVNTEGLLAIQCHGLLIVLHFHAPEGNDYILAEGSGRGAVRICSSVNWRNMAMWFTDLEWASNR